MAGTLPMQDAQTRRFSFAVSEDSRNVNSGAGGDSMNNSVMVDLDICVRNNKDYEHFDAQDEIQISQNAAERLRLITAAPESLYEKSNDKRDKKAFGSKRVSLFKQNDEEDVLTSKQLNNEQEFFSPVHMRLRKELIDTREKL